MIHVCFQLTAVAFVQGAGGRMRVLFAIDRAGEPLFDGDPALLVEHRPGIGAAPHIEGAELVPLAAIDHLAAVVAVALAQLIDASYDREGGFRRELLLGQHLEFDADERLFDHL